MKIPPSEKAIVVSREYKDDRALDVSDRLIIRRLLFDQTLPTVVEPAARRFVSEIRSSDH